MSPPIPTKHAKMAEGGATWWGSWLDTAKTTGSNVLEFMKRDLDEFTQAVQNETKSYVSTAAGALKETLNIDDTDSTANKVKRSVSTFLGSVSHALTTPTTDENDQSELCVIRNCEPVLMDRMQAQLYSVQSNPKTYLEDANEDSHLYDDWMHNFDLETKQTELADIMVSNPEVQKLYTKLVPNSVSHVVFWHRYFYKIHRILEMEARKKELVQRVIEPAEKDEISWDDDEEFLNPDQDFDVPEEVTDQLLTAYQKECDDRASRHHQQRRKSSTSSSTNTKADNDPIIHPKKAPEIVTVTSNESFVVLDAKQSSNTDDVSSAVLSSASNDATTTTAPEVTINECNDLATAKLVTKERGDLVVVGRAGSVGTSPASSNKEGSNDEEWEREFDLDVAEDEKQQLPTAKQQLPLTPSTTEVEEDWENWE